MKQKSQASQALLLKGRRIWITRPGQFGQTLTDELNHLGAVATWCPLLEISATPLMEPLQKAIQQLSAYDWVICTSRFAVLFGLQTLKNPSLLPELKWAAVGAGSAAELERKGVLKVVAPESPPFNSEALLAKLAPFNMVGQKVLLLQGNGGREFLNAALMKRQALLTIVEAYRRQAPSVDIQKVWQAGSLPETVILTSMEGWNSIRTLLPATRIMALQTCYWIVLGARIAQALQEQGFEKIVVVESVDKAAVLQAASLISR